ncbi:hypothetical protein [Pseudomonas sp. DrBHI1]|uniref:hypothetical protein n=1 Tax=Pseudomonas sp. DrBHI1 TaxID=2006091 RepID=UPI000B593EB6|nr:hypothetical protein [Pseudomonas sp. DrBHI1]OWQ36522.1 hypothetical protein CC207_08430 [Pseudomonas sp. DrBHI1]
MSAPIDVKQNPDGSWTAKGGSSLTIVSVTALTEHKAVSGHAVAITALLSWGNGWIKCEDAKPADGQVVVVWRKWPNWNCFAAELDSWQADSSDTEGGAWYEAEESCQHIETCADGPGEVQRPITTHWHPLPANPTE